MSEADAARATDGTPTASAEKFDSASKFGEAVHSTFGYVGSKTTGGVDPVKARADVKATLLEPKNSLFLARCKATCKYNESGDAPSDWDAYELGFKASIWTAVRELMAKDGKRKAGNDTNDVPDVGGAAADSKPLGPEPKPAAKKAKITLTLTLTLT